MRTRHSLVLTKPSRVCSTHAGAIKRPWTNKCQIAVYELTFFGDLLTIHCLQPGPAKVKFIVEFPTPKHPKEMARFLGMVKYLARNVTKLSQWTFHMRSLRSLHMGLRTWENSMILKCYYPHSASYNFTSLIRISCDASKMALDTILQQHHEEEWLPVAHTSHAIIDILNRSSWKH